MYPYSYFQQESTSGNAVGGSDGSGGNGGGGNSGSGSIHSSARIVEPAPSVASSTAAVANFPTGNGGAVEPRLSGAEEHFFSHPAAFDSGGYRSSISESLGDFDLNGAGSGYPFFQRPSTSCGGSDAGSGGSVKSGFSIMGKKR